MSLSSVCMCEGVCACVCACVCLRVCVRVCLCRKKNQKTQLQTLHWWLSAKRSSRSDALTDFVTRVKFMDMLRHLINCRFISEVNSHSPSLYVVVRPSVCLSVVCNVCAPYSGDWNFRQYFYTIRKIIYPSFLRRRMVGGGDPFYVKFWVNRPPLQQSSRFSTDIRS